MREMSVIVRTVVRPICSLIAVFGFYLLLHGETIPGGGFGGGVILAFSLVLFTLAFGIRETEKKLSMNAAVIFQCTAALAFLALLFITYKEGYSFIGLNILTLRDISLGILICMSIYTGFISLAAARVKEKMIR